jgi:hypothetical protein
MNWSIEFVEDKNYVKTTLAGDFNPSDHLRMIEDILSMKYWQSGMNVLLDSRQVNYLNSGIDAMKETGNNMKRFDEQIGMGKAAILMGTTVSFVRGNLKIVS